MKQTYGQFWDGYVDEAFPRLQQSDARLTYPGQEWGNEASWQRIFEKLFVPSGVAGWKTAVEIGGGAGKYTERVLRAGPDCRLLGFDVSQSFIDATAARLGDFIATGRLSLHRIDPLRPDGMVRQLEAEGLAGQVDAVFSIDAMVHVDLTYLTAYWINAALLLKPGGRIAMTLGDPTTPSGFQKILRDIRNFYRFQGRICSKFEYLSADIVRAVLTRVGFAIEVLEPWSNHVGRPPRDLYLIARLDRPDLAANLRAALQADPARRTPPPAASLRGDSYAEVWTREAARAIAGQPDRPPAAAVLARLFAGAELKGWQRAIEIGIGDARYTEAVLAANPQVRLTAFDVSDRVMQSAAAKLAPHVASGRLGFLPVDPLHPDGILAAFEREHLEREVDAVFSIDAMQHVDLQYQIAYWLNAALVLRVGGWLVFSVGDATTPAGFKRLIAGIAQNFPNQGQASSGFEFQSFGLLRPLLERIGFEITYAGHWNPLDGSETGRDLFVAAQMVRPEAADALRGHLSTGIATPRFAGRDKQGAAPAAEPHPQPAAEPYPQPAAEPYPQPAAEPYSQPAAEPDCQPQAEPYSQHQAEAGSQPREGPQSQPGAEPHLEPETGQDAAVDLARSLGQAVWRQLHLQANPGVSRARLAAQMREQWGGNRREYTRLGHLVLRDLAESGLTLHKSGIRPGNPAAAGEDDDETGQ